MESNGIFSAGEKVTDSGEAVGVNVQEWERRNGAGNSFEVNDRGNNGEGVERLGEIVSENELRKVGMGANDLMTEGAIRADEEVQKSNTLLGSYGGIAINKLAGRGADPVTDNQVVDELVEDMERGEKNFKETGNVVQFYDGFDRVRQYYQIGEEVRKDSEVVG